MISVPALDERRGDRAAAVDRGERGREDHGVEDGETARRRRERGRLRTDGGRVEGAMIVEMDDQIHLAETPDERSWRENVGGYHVSDHLR